MYNLSKTRDIREGIESISKLNRSEDKKRLFLFCLFLMLFFNRLFNINSIRHSSSSREFFGNLKKLYRSTTLNLFMAITNNRTCFIFDKDESTKILIQMIYEIPSTKICRKFNLLRSIDEPVSQTIRRLIANIERAAKKENKIVKRHQKQATEEISSTITVQLLDKNNQLINENETNKQAWLNCQTLIINDQSYNIEYNAPGNNP